MKRVINYLWPVLLCLLCGYTSSLFQSVSMNEWYPFLYKSSLTPPGFVFPIVWTILYVFIGLSLGRIWGRGVKFEVTEWFVQLFLNFIWSIVFFYFRQPFYGFVVILILDVVVADYIIRTYKKDKIAMSFFIPYLIWLLLASYLNAYIYLYN